jgi:FkbM family methyltransferase
MGTNAERTIRTCHGIFAIDKERDKKMAEALESREYPSGCLLKVARAFVSKKSTVIDIGAHIGTFSIPVAFVSGKVIAFEPSQETFGFLTRNARENGVDIKLSNKALGKEKGSGTLITCNASNAGANTIVSGDGITITTLDDEVEYADFIKMDVEGMELEVLYGGTKLIEHSRPVVFFEVNLSQLRAHNTSPRAIEKFFTNLGYRLYFPIEKKNGMLARIRSATLLTVLLAPRAWFFSSSSAPFDLLAVPKEMSLPLPYTGFTSAILYAVSNNIIVKMKRIVKFFTV